VGLNPPHHIYTTTTYIGYQLQQESSSNSAHWCISRLLVTRRHTSMTCCSQFPT